MTRARDPAVKLFGSTIPMTDPGPDHEEICRGITNTGAKDPKPVVTEDKDQDQPIVSSILNNSCEDKNHTSLLDDKVTTDSNPEHNQSEADISGQEKVLKKPDKILPCPRCNSMNTKFCYYNNYNISQPRHFCKNCQRYWTAGGAMRNVPVGAGRRKSKHSVNNHSQPSVLSDPTTTSNGNGAVLNFGPEAPQCEPMPSLLNVGEQEHVAEMCSLAGGENGKEPSCGSSATSSKSVTNGLPEKAVAVEQNGVHGCYNVLAPMHPLQYSPAPPWPYWPPGWSDVAAMGVSHCSENGIPNPGPWVPPPMMAAPAFYPPVVPFPFMPAPYWAWPNGAWNVPWSGANCNSAYLGKHSRDGSEVEKSEKSLWIPKTLRIDDPDEAAKSSIWSTLGIKPDASVKRRGLFNDIQSNDETGGHTSPPVEILHANPAALSRSRTFQENT